MLLARSGRCSNLATKVLISGEFQFRRKLPKHTFTAGGPSYLTIKSGAVSKSSERTTRGIVMIKRTDGMRESILKDMRLYTLRPSVCPRHTSMTTCRTCRRRYFAGIYCPRCTLHVIIAMRIRRTPREKQTD